MGAIKPLRTIAFTGAGGKTTALFLWAHVLADSMHLPVFVTTTTHLGVWQRAAATRHVVVQTPQDVARYRKFVQHGVNLWSGGVSSERKRLSPPPPAALEGLRHLAQEMGAILLIEADGARGKPLKTPAAHEPVVPDWVDAVVTVAGLWGLGQSLSEETVFRSALFAQQSAMHSGETIQLPHLISELLHPQGGLKGGSANALRIAWLTGRLPIDQGAQRHLPGAPWQWRNSTVLQAEEVMRLRIANELLDDYHAVLFSERNRAPSFVQARTPPLRPFDQFSIHSYLRIAGVILAAGGSRRMGQPKAMLDWHGQPLVVRAAQAALDGGLQPVTVVAGDDFEAVCHAVAHLPVTVLQNTDWQEGQSTSVRMGVQAAQNAHAGAAIFLPVDMPYLSADLIAALAAAYRRAPAMVIAPAVQGRRANPVLFDSALFAKLEALQGDTGGRALFQQFPPRLMRWHDARILHDLDTPQAYAAAMRGTLE